MADTTYTAEIKVTKSVPQQNQTDRYGAVTVSVPATEQRLGHVTLTGTDLDELRVRVGLVMEQVTD